MKRKILLICTVLLCFCLCCSAQQRRRVTGVPMYFELDEHGDTVFMETLDPIWVFPAR